MTWTGLHLRRRAADAVGRAVLELLDRAIVALEPPEAAPAEPVPEPPTPPASVSEPGPIEVPVDAPSSSETATALPPLPATRSSARAPAAPKRPKSPRAKPTEAPPPPEPPPPPPPEQRLAVAREREQRREARARPGILTWLDGHEGSAKTVALMQHVAETYKISGQRFSVLLEELRDEQLLHYDPASQTVTLTDAGRAAASQPSP